jgi:hypothetical protein
MKQLNIYTNIPQRIGLIYGPGLRLSVSPPSLMNFLFVNIKTWEIYPKKTVVKYCTWRRETDFCKRGLFDNRCEVDSKRYQWTCKERANFPHELFGILIFSLNMPLVACVSSGRPFCYFELAESPPWWAAAWRAVTNVPAATSKVYIVETSGDRRIRDGKRPALVVIIYGFKE